MRKNPYQLPKAVYHQCLWLLKDMDRLKKHEAISNYALDSSEPVFFVDDEEVIKDEAVLEQSKWKLDCIRRAILKVPEEYRQSTIDCIVFDVPYGDMAHENTWRKWRKVFIWELAKNLLMI